MQHDRSNVEALGRRGKYPGTWAIVCIIGSLSLGGRAVHALIQGHLNVPFVDDAVSAAGEPALFYALVLALALVSILGLVGGYTYWQEWRAGRAAA